MATTLPAKMFTERPNQNNDECDLCSCGKACRNSKGVATKLVVDMTAFLAEFATKAGPHARPRAFQPNCRSMAALFPRPQKRCVSALLLTTDSMVPAVTGARIAFAAVATPNDERLDGRLHELVPIRHALRS